jgi:hypothetical protein
MAGINHIADLASIRAKAFDNVMEAYLLYITAVAKLAGPKTAQSVEPPGDAPPLPRGFGWLPVAEDIHAARDMMKAAAGADGFGIEMALHPDFYADYMETVESWADVTLDDRGAWDYFGGPYMLTTWKEVEGGRPVKKVAKTNVTAAAFAEDFVNFDSKIKTMMAAEAREFINAKRDQRRKRQEVLKKEGGLKKKKGGGMPSVAARGVYAAGAAALFGTPPQPTAKTPPVFAATSETQDELDAFFSSQLGGSSAKPAPVPVQTATPAGDMSAELDDILSFEGMNNNPLRRNRRVR